MIPRSRGNGTREDAIAKGIALIEAYFEEPPPIKIIAIEHSVIVPMTNSRGEILETPLVAVFDLVTREEGQTKIHEFKTSRSAYSRFQADTSLQATCYLAAGNEIFGEVEFEFTVLVKTAVPKVQRQSVEREASDFGRLGDLIEGIERAVAAKAFFPIESPQNCSYCPYRRQCRDWGMGVRKDQDDVSTQISEASKC